MELAIMLVNRIWLRRNSSVQLPYLTKKIAVATVVATFSFVYLDVESIWQCGSLLSIVEREKTNLVGYLAAGLVLATFCMRSMTRLRLIALASNLAFISYGYLAHLMPVLFLHVILLPVNAYRLAQSFGLSERTTHKIR